MLAEPGVKPRVDPSLLHEVKYDGVRTLFVVEDGHVTFWSRGGHDITAAFPELAEVPSHLKMQNGVGDGEIVVGNGTMADFNAISRRVHVQDPLKIRLRSRETPTNLRVFDLPVYERDDLTVNGVRLSLMQRRELLAATIRGGLPNGVVCMGDAGEFGDGAAFFRSCLEQGYEGMMVKSKAGLYYPGKRHPDWGKSKLEQTADFQVVGYTWGEGWRGERQLFGALVLSTGTPGNLQYCGEVGGGFTNEELETIGAHLRTIAVSQCPMVKLEKVEGLCSWVAPGLVVEVKFMDWTSDRKLRFPRFKAVRRMR